MCEQPLGHGTDTLVKEMMFWCGGCEGVCRCCGGQVWIMSSPFSGGTDLSSLMETHRLIAGNPAQSAVRGAQMRSRCLSHCGSADCDP